LVAGLRDRLEAYRARPGPAPGTTGECCALALCHPSNPVTPMASGKRRFVSEFGPGDEPGAPGPIPTPDHTTGIPAAPATHPPEAPLVPSDTAIALFWNSYGPALTLIAAGLLIVILLLVTAFEA